MIDKKLVKAFWQRRSAISDSASFESICNLEQIPDHVQLKIKIESLTVFEWLTEVKNKRVLDLGAGVGQWAFRFADRMAQWVVAVEYIESLAKIGMAEKRKRGIANVDFVVSSAEQFCSKGSFDIIFISGLFVYLNDEQCKRLMAALPDHCHRDTIIMVRDGSGVDGRFEIKDRFSSTLGSYYSATYRTREDYFNLFRSAGYKNTRVKNMFPEGHVLNKYPETRLCLFLFQRV